MNKAELFEILDKEKVTQNNIFDHQVAEYENIYTYLKELNETEKASDIKEITEKAVVTPNKPISEFVIALVTYFENTEKSTAIENLTKKAVAMSKWQYVLFFTRVLLEKNPHDLVASALKIQALEKIGTDTEELKNEIRHFTTVKEDEVKMLLYLVDMFDKENDSETAIYHLKRALARAIKIKSIKDVKDVSEKFLKRKDVELSQIVNMFDTPSAKSLGEKFDTCFQDVYKAVQKSGNTELLVHAIKLIITSSTKNTKYKSDIVNAYKELYKDSSRLEECLNQSGLTTDYHLDLKDAIQQFEKDISIDKGTFVYHNSYGIGRVTNIDSDGISIDFIKKRGHRMSHSMALSSLTVLEKNHIWVLKTFVSKEKLAKKFNEDTRWGLETLIKSGDNSFKLMKKEIVPSILSESEWSLFNQKAKKIIKTDSYIYALPNAVDTYEISATPISNNDKIYSEFRHTPDVFGRIALVRKALELGVQYDSECFQYMLKSFGTELASPNITEEYLIAHLFLSTLANGRNKIVDAKAYLRKSDYEVLVRIPSSKLPDFFSRIEDTELRKYMVDKINKFLPNWQEVLTECYTLSPDQSIEKVMAKRSIDTFKVDMMKKSFFIIKQNPTLFLYLFKKYAATPEEWNEAGKSTYDLILAQLDVYNTFPNSDKSRSMYTSLFDSRRIYSFIENTNDDLILSNLEKNISLSPTLDELKKQEIKHIVGLKLEKSGAKLDNQDAKKSLRKPLPSGILCLASSLENAKKELEHLINVEIPANAKDIGDARELGDLRENAEYQYAKDKQRLLTNQMKKLESDIKDAKVVTPDSFDTSSVGFGTVVTIKDELENKEFTYTILGQWESDPDKNIISINAPAIKEIYGAAKGECREFTINGDKKKWTIKDITKYTN